jgi:outer membrane protein OmpA-like peptidoglycan-associated protein
MDDEAAGVTISGAVPDEKTRGAILDALKAVFGADAVKGDLTVDPNRDAAPWLTNLRPALEALKIPGLHAAFDGGAVEIGGAIPDRERVASSLKSVFGEGVRVGALVDSVGDWATIANAKASEALVALKTGFSAADLVSALNLSIVNFPADSAEVPAPIMSFLDTAAASLKALPAGYEIEVAGYTDDTGDPAANLALSLHRAEAVRNALVKAGAPAGALTAKGYGSVNPVATNDTEEGRFRNRRIEYHVTKTP